MSIEQAKKLVAEQRFFSANEVLKSALASGKRAVGRARIVFVATRA